MGHLPRLHGLCATLPWPCATDPWATGGWLHGPCATAPWATCDGSMGHRRLASCRARAPRHCRLSTPPSSRDGGVERLLLRSLGGGGAPTGASLHLRPPLRRRRPRREYADCTYVSDCAVCGPRVRACRGGRPRWRSAPRTALQRSRTPLTAIATAAALAPSTWVDSAGRSRLLGFRHGFRSAPISRRDVQMDVRGPTLIATTAAPARSSNRLIAPTAPTRHGHCGPRMTMTRSPHGSPCRAVGC